jgi:DNA invertase Pin-like site-specific DNA recombinase
MVDEGEEKVTREHLAKDAYLYVRHSASGSMGESREIVERHERLRERAVALGWPSERIHVIECDRGQPAAGGAAREGFQRLVAEVGMGRAGIVMALEVSRLARRSSDGDRLLEMCALTGTLVLVEDGLYDPRASNDRLALALKAMPELKSCPCRSRRRGGKGAAPLPAGAIAGEQVAVVLD